MQLSFRGLGRAVRSWTGVLAFCAGALWPAGAAQAQAAVAEVCESDDGDAKPAWKQFALAGACFEVSGSASYVYQKVVDTKGMAIPALNTQRGPVFRQGAAPAPGQGGGSGPSYVHTGSLSLRVDTTRKTAAGDLKTGVEVKYQKASDDSGSGQLTLTEGVVSWAGWTAGYSDSLMNFWAGDFQFSATAPSRTVAIASYDFRLTENLKLTVAAETGVPTAPSSGGSFAPVAWDDPVASARLHYQADDLTLQLSGLYHELTVGGATTFLRRFNRAREERMAGWAASFGLTRALPQMSEGSEFSMQATYAVNASSYLGTAADLASFSALIPMPGETEGWSVVGSYHHAWSEQWATNVMASRLALDIKMPLASPNAVATRYAANLIWKPVDDLQIGGELGWVDFTLRPNGVAGFFPGTGGQAMVGYLFATWTF